MLTFLRINRNIRSLKRYRDILGILIKYGFGHFVEELNINYYLELGRRIVTLGTAPRDIERLSQPERLRLAIEELGPTFIKLGQLLSTRPDIIPREYIEEFRKLQDKVPAVGFDAISRQFEKEFGQPIREVFAEIDETPLAAASIAQVHRARLVEGDDVVIKVCRPGIEKVIETDIDILAGLAVLIERHIPAMAHYSPTQLVKEFRRTIYREMDFTREGHTTDRFAANFADDPGVCIPSVFWEWSGERILTMEYLLGTKVSDLGTLRDKELDLEDIARRGADFFLRQVLEFGLFHGDPHPGNFFIRDDGSICLLDFGMVGRLDDEIKNHLVELLLGVLERDVDRIITQLLYSGDLSDESNMRELRRDLNDFLADYYELPLNEIHVGALLSDFVEILNTYRIRFPSDLMLLAKALVTIEGIGRQLDPNFNMIASLRPFMERLIRQRLSPPNLARQVAILVSSYGNLARTLPRDIKEFLNRLNRNKIKIDLEHRGLERLIADLDKSSNRISFSMIIAALIIGSSLIMQSDKGPQLFGFPTLGLLGYSFAAFLGLWLAIAILRSGRL